MASISISVPSKFRTNHRVLIVDGDVWVLKKLLLKFKYKVWTSKLLNEALDMLGEKNDKHNFDIVIVDLNMWDMDVYQFIQHVDRKLNIPVIVMAKDGVPSCVIKGIQSGACSYLSKPIEAKEAQFIWQHVYRKRMATQPQSVGDEGIPSPICENILPTKKNKREFGESSNQGEGGGDMNVKKSRAIWTTELHDKFEKAVAQIKSTNERLGPKKIFELMGESSLTKEQIASHLQKYRIKNDGIKAAQESDTNIHPQQLPQLVQQQNTMMDGNCEHNMNSYEEYTSAYRPPLQQPHGSNIGNSYEPCLLPQLLEQEYARIVMSHNNTQNIGLNAYQNQNLPNLGAYNNNGPIAYQNPPNLSAYGYNGSNTRQIQNPPNLDTYDNTDATARILIEDCDESNFMEDIFKEMDESAAAGN